MSSLGSILARVALRYGTDYPNFPLLQQSKDNIKSYEGIYTKAFLKVRGMSYRSTLVTISVKFYEMLLRSFISNYFVLHIDIGLRVNSDKNK